MSNDLIKRSDAIKAYNEAMDELVKWQMEEWQLGDFSECEFNTTDCKHIVRKLEAIPSADRPQEWIPCSERLPKESGEYLVYCEIFFIPDHVDEPSSRKGMAIAYYHREFNEWLGEDKVYAWMSLPKPWKGADDE